MHMSTSVDMTCTSNERMPAVKRFMRRHDSIVCMKSLQRRFKGFAGIIGSTAVIAAVAIAGMFALLSVAVIALQPIISYWTQAPTELQDTMIAEHIKMYDKDGQQFAEVWSENREPVAKLDDVSKDMRHAIVSAEDKDFYNHGAVNLLATARSFLTGSGGGSGITQQLVKNLQYFSMNANDASKAEATETTIARKLKEMKLAMAYEDSHSKDDILLKYLNTVSIGSGNVYGIETASQEIFGKSAKGLNLAESAALAGSVNNTTKYNLLNMDDAQTAKWVKDRQTYVLDRMLANGYIDRKQHDDAVKAPIETRITYMKGGCGSSEFPFYCQYVLDYMQRDTQFGATPEERSIRIAQGGLAVYTSMDSNLMRQANAQVKNDLGVQNRVAMPIAVVQPGGHVLAIAQNRDWGTDADAGQTQVVLPDKGTQTGSTYKMITLATAVANGWTEDQLNQVNGYCPWTKAGYDAPAGGIRNSSGNGCGFQAGRIGYLKATAYSSNTYYAELSTEVGIDKVMDMSRRMGLTVPDNISSRSASFTLGVASDSPIQMAAAYATFANKGVFCPATPIKNYAMLDGSPFMAADTYNPSSGGCTAVMTPKQASIVLKAQNANVNDAGIPGRFGEGGAVPGHMTVGKSGTTNDLANSSWSATVGQYAMFANAYDPRGNYAYPLTYYVYRGMGVNGYYHSAMSTVKDIAAANLNGQPDIPLDLNSQDNNPVNVPKNNKGVKIVPDVTGMDAESALKTMKNAGIEGRILKKGTDKASSGNDMATYSKGTAVAQSVPAGTRFAEGSKKVVEITLME